VPRREYDLAGALLAAAIEAAEATGTDVRTELQAVARDHGRSIGARVQELAGPRPSKAKQREALVAVLAEHGFEPRLVDRDVVLASCPFHSLSQRFTDLVCGMNLHLLEGVRSAASLGDDELQPCLEPEPGQCCVRLRSRQPT
jgi:predicted ArsR family transcriptional regulator